MSSTLATRSAAETAADQAVLREVLRSMLLPSASVDLAPLLVPLLPVGIGVLGGMIGTVSGVLITQRRSDRREDKAWERERERERDRWAREDQRRFTDHKRELYSEFLAQADRWYRDMQDIQVMQQTHGEEPDPKRWGEWIEPLGLTNARKSTSCSGC